MSPAPPLAGLKVLEMGGKGAIPHCAMMLADMGAEIIRVDRPDPDQAENPPRDMRRGRRSIAIDLKSVRGRELFLELVEGSDALLEGFRPGAMERLKLGPAELLAKNPRLVYARITGWGQEGTLQHTAAHDLNYIALTGALAAVGPPEGPIPPLNFAGDGAGGMLAAFGVVCALLSARQDGKGQVVDAAMVDASANLMTNMYLRKTTGEWIDERYSNKIDGAFPCYGAYETSDGKFVSLGSIEERFFDTFANLVGLEVSEEARWDPEHWPDLRAELVGIFKSRTFEQWRDLLEGTDSCFAPVLSMSEAVHHPHNVERKTFVTIDSVLQPAPVPRFSRNPAPAPRGAARDGEHTEEILRELGCDSSVVQDLLESGVVASA